MKFIHKVATCATIAYTALPQDQCQGMSMYEEAMLELQ